MEKRIVFDMSNRHLTSLARDLVQCIRHSKGCELLGSGVSLFDQFRYEHALKYDHPIWTVALKWASKQGDLESVKKIIQRGKCILDVGLACAAHNGHMNVVQFFMELDKNLPIRATIQRACTYGHVDVLKYVFEVSSKSKTYIRDHQDILFSEGFCQAVANNHSHVVRFLIFNRIVLDVNKCALEIYRYRNKLELLKIVFKYFLLHKYRGDCHLLPFPLRDALVQLGCCVSPKLIYKIMNSMDIHIIRIVLYCFPTCVECFDKNYFFLDCHSDIVLNYKLDKILRNITIDYSNRGHWFMYPYIKHRKECQKMFHLCCSFVFSKYLIRFINKFISF